MNGKKIEIAAGRRDVVGMALLTLAKELWVLKDRQMVVETLLQEKGLLSEVDRYQPSPELAERIASERDRFIGSVTATLLTGKPNDS